MLSGTSNRPRVSDLAPICLGTPLTILGPSQFTSSTDGPRIIATGARDSCMQINIDGVTMANLAEYGGNAGANVNMQVLVHSPIGDPEAGWIK